jgi:hypothetical protein
LIFSIFNLVGSLSTAGLYRLLVLGWSLLIFRA